MQMPGRLKGPQLQGRGAGPGAAPSREEVLGRPSLRTNGVASPAGGGRGPARLLAALAACVRPGLEFGVLSSGRRVGGLQLVPLREAL